MKMRKYNSQRITHTVGWWRGVVASVVRRKLPYGGPG